MADAMGHAGRSSWAAKSTFRATITSLILNGLARTLMLRIFGEKEKKATTHIANYIANYIKIYNDIN